MFLKLTLLSIKSEVDIGCELILKKGKRLASTLMRKSKTLIKTLWISRIQRRSLEYYLLKGEVLLKQNKENSAFDILEEGLQFYPKNYDINSKLANLSVKRENWGAAKVYWETVMESSDKKSAEDYLNFYKVLMKMEKREDAQRILKIGMSKFPTNKKFILELSDLLIGKREWIQTTELLADLFKNGENPSQVKAYLNLSKAYLKLEAYVEAENVLKKGIAEKPENKKILNKLADIAVNKKDWNTAIRRYEGICELSKQKTPLNTLVRLSMLNQITGNTNTADHILQRALNDYCDTIKKDEKGFRKIILYDNGETRIEFYKKLERTNRVVLTFDSVNMVWKDSPFGFKILQKQQNLDIISVRKRKKKAYHQDLSREEFTDTISELIKDYDDKIAYGYSLGAYSAFYYTSNFDCRILAISPRQPIHPKYGDPKEIPKFEFKHELTQPYNGVISPIIAYDPKNKLDSAYVKKQLKQTYPNAKLVDLPYGGHGMARHLLRMGILKDFVLTFINEDRVARYDKKLRSKSANYYWTIGRACFNRNKIKWATEFAERSLQLFPTGKNAIKLKIDLLKRKKLFDDAIEFVKELIERYPKKLDHRLALIDLYIQTNKLIEAEEEIESASKVFKNTIRIDDRKNRVEAAKSYNKV